MSEKPKVSPEAFAATSTPEVLAMIDETRAAEARGEQMFQPFSFHAPMTTESRDALVEQLARADFAAYGRDTMVNAYKDYSWAGLLIAAGDGAPFAKTYLKQFRDGARRKLAIIAAERAAVWEAAAAAADAEIGNGPDDAGYNDALADMAHICRQEAIRAKGA